MFFLDYFTINEICLSKARHATFYTENKEYVLQLL